MIHNIADMITNSEVFLAAWVARLLVYGLIGLGAWEVARWIGWRVASHLRLDRSFGHYLRVRRSFEKYLAAGKQFEADQNIVIKSLRDANADARQRINLYASGMVLDFYGWLDVRGYQQAGRDHWVQQDTPYNQLSTYKLFQEYSAERSSLSLGFYQDRVNYARQIEEANDKKQTP